MNGNCVDSGVTPNNTLDNFYKYLIILSNRILLKYSILLYLKLLFNFRRSDLNPSFENVEEGFTCPSVIKYARPQLARAASGVWKYIINTGEHTQTLRLEKCS